MKQALQSPTRGLMAISALAILLLGLISLVSACDSGIFDECGVCDGDSRSCCSEGGFMSTICECDVDRCGDLCVDFITDCGECLPDVDDISSCADCKGVANGTSVVDACGVCEGGNECLDCFGTVGGSAVLDNCGICEGDSRSCCSDAGIHNGESCVCDHDGICDETCSSIVDECGECGGLSRSCCQDLGVFNATTEICTCETGFCGATCGSVVDNCGVCRGDSRSCCSGQGVFFLLACECDGGYCGTSCESTYDLCGQCAGDSRACCNNEGVYTYFEDLSEGGVSENRCVCDESSLFCGSSCEGEYDACGVCGGDSSRCCNERGVFRNITLSCSCYTLADPDDNCANANTTTCGPEDNCGVCDGDSRSCCGDLGVMGTDGKCICDPGLCGDSCDMFVTLCGVCRASVSDTSECIDCLGVVAGVAEVDFCNVCGGDSRSCCSENGTHNGIECVCFSSSCGDDCGEELDGCDVCGGDSRSCCSEKGEFDSIMNVCVCDGGFCGTLCDEETGFCTDSSSSSSTASTENDFESSGGTSSLSVDLVPANNAISYSVWFFSIGLVAASCGWGVHLCKKAGSKSKKKKNAVSAF